MVIAEMGSGGAESVASQLAVHSQLRGDDVRIVSEGGWRSTKLEEGGVPTVHVPLASPSVFSLIRSARAVRALLDRHPADVIHAHNVRATVAARLGAQRLTGRPPIVTTVHGLPEERYRAASRLLRACADQVVAVSSDVADRLVGGGLSRHRVTVIENAPAAIALPDRDRSRSELGIDPGRRVALCLARLIPPKRHDLLLEAWRETSSSSLLLIAGDGPRRVALERQAQTLGVAARVRFLGECRDVGRLLAVSDLVVLATDREGLPVTVLEAMAAGVPVVASAVGGLLSLGPDAVRLVEPGSAAALASGIRDVWSDPLASERRVMVARGLIRERYSMEHLAEAYFELYEEAIHVG